MVAFLISTMCLLRADKNCIRTLHFIKNVATNTTINPADWVQPFEINPGKPEIIRTLNSSRLKFVVKTFIIGKTH